MIRVFVIVCTLAASVEAVINIIVFIAATRELTRLFDGIFYLFIAVFGCYVFFSRF